MTQLRQTIDLDHLEKVARAMTFIDANLDGVLNATQHDFIEEFDKITVLDLIALARRAPDQATGAPAPVCADERTPTDLSHRLRETADQQPGWKPLLTAAADEIERYYGGMLAWKKTAEKKDRDWNAERMARVDERCAALAQQAAPAQPATDHATGAARADEDDQWIFDLAAKHESRGRELFGPVTFSSTALVEFVREARQQYAATPSPSALQVQTDGPLTNEGTSAPQVQEGAPGLEVLNEYWGVYRTSKDGTEEGWVKDNGRYVSLFWPRERAEHICINDEYEPRRVFLVAGEAPAAASTSAKVGQADEQALRPVEQSALGMSIVELDAWLETDGCEPLTVSQGESVGLVLHELKRLRALCPECKGTGMADSGGTHPWGEPALIPCGCPLTQPATDHATGAARADDLALMLECVKSVSIGHVDHNHLTDEQTCSECKAALDHGDEHAADCLTLRARDFLTQPAAASTPSAPANSPEFEGIGNQRWSKEAEMVESWLATQPAASSGASSGIGAESALHWPHGSTEVACSSCGLTMGESRLLSDLKRGEMVAVASSGIGAVAPQSVSDERKSFDAYWNALDNAGATYAEIEMCEYAAWQAWQARPRHCLALPLSAYPKGTTYRAADAPQQAADAKDAALNLAKQALVSSYSKDLARDVERRAAIKAIDRAAMGAPADGGSDAS